MALPWNERITMLSIHPDAATRDNVARLASELLEIKVEVQQVAEQLLTLYTDCNETTKPKVYGAILGLHKRLDILSKL